MCTNCVKQTASWEATPQHRMLRPVMTQMGGMAGQEGGDMCTHIADSFTAQQQLTQQCNYIPKRTSNGGKKKHKNFMRTFSAAKTKKVNYLQGYFFPSFKILMSLTCYCIYLVQNYSA